MIPVALLGTSASIASKSAALAMVKRLLWTFVVKYFSDVAADSIKDMLNKSGSKMIDATAALCVRDAKALSNHSDMRLFKNIMIKALSGNITFTPEDIVTIINADPTDIDKSIASFSDDRPIESRIESLFRDLKHQPFWKNLSHSRAKRLIAEYLDAFDAAVNMLRQSMTLPLQMRRIFIAEIIDNRIEPDRSKWEARIQAFQPVCNNPVLSLLMTRDDKGRIIPFKDLEALSS